MEALLVRGEVVIKDEGQKREKEEEKSVNSEGDQGNEGYG